MALSFINETNLKYRFCCNIPSFTPAIQESVLEASMLPYEKIFVQCQKGEEKRKEKKGEEEVLKSDRNSHLQKDDFSCFHNAVKSMGCAQNHKGNGLVPVQFQVCDMCCKLHIEINLLTKASQYMKGAEVTVFQSILSKPWQATKLTHTVQFSSLI